MISRCYFQRAYSTRIIAILIAISASGANAQQFPATSELQFQVEAAPKPKPDVERAKKLSDMRARKGDRPDSEVRESPAGDVYRPDGPRFPPSTMRPGERHPPMNLPAMRPPFADLDVQSKTLDQLMESPIVKKLLGLMEQNLELKAQLRIQQIEMEHRLMASELKLNSERERAEIALNRAREMQERTERQIKESLVEREELRAHNERLKRELEEMHRVNESLREEQRRAQEVIEQKH
jgi:hypothetical protein